jgi:hypothetical protein
VNTVGGFRITQLMLNMFRRPEDPPDYGYLYLIPAGVFAAGYSTGLLSNASPTMHDMAYLGSSLACIMAIAGLSSQKTARIGNAMGMYSGGGGDHGRRAPKSFRLLFFLSFLPTSFFFLLFLLFFFHRYAWCWHWHCDHLWIYSNGVGGSCSDGWASHGGWSRWSHSCQSGTADRSSSGIASPLILSPVFLSSMCRCTLYFFFSLSFFLLSSVLSLLSFSCGSCPFFSVPLFSFSLERGISLTRCISLQTLLTHTCVHVFFCPPHLAFYHCTCCCVCVCVCSWLHSSIPWLVRLPCARLPRSIWPKRMSVTAWMQCTVRRSS